MSETRLALPSAAQRAWQDMEIGMFIHWAPNVYQSENAHLYDDLSTPQDRIDPYLLDTDQWAQVACELGARYIVMVAKHVGGFCTWQTHTSEYGVRNAAWRGGKGDIIADLSASCRRYGLKLGVYLSPRDDFHGIGTGGIAADAEAQRAYDAKYRAQLTELLSRYGEMVEVWFDGSSDCDVGDILARYAPGAMIFQSKYATIRWVGNEDGFATYPAWNAVRAEDARTGVSMQRHGTPDGDVWMPCECDTTIRADWFWSEHNERTLRGLDELMGVYYRSVGNGVMLLLNANPDRTGRIPDADARRAREFGEAVRARFGSPIAQCADCVGATVTLALPPCARVDHAVLMEDTALGERVRAYELWARADGQWSRVARGSAIGHKHIAPFAATPADALELRVTESVGEPHIRGFAAHFIGQLPTGLPEA